MSLLTRLLASSCIAALAVAMAWPGGDDAPRVDDSIGPAQPWNEAEGESAMDEEGPAEEPLSAEDFQEGSKSP